MVKNSKQPTLDFEILTELKDIIAYTPSGQYDDLFLLNFAKELNALILSNDKYEDKQFVDDTELYDYYSIKYVLA